MCQRATGASPVAAPDCGRKHLGLPALAVLAAGDEVLTETAFLSTRVQRAGCARLVDVNTLNVNALNDRIQGAPDDPVQHCRDWLDAIDTELAGEIHLAEHSHVLPESADWPQDEIAIDDHGSRMCDAVWQIFDQAVARWRRVPNLIDWDADMAPLDELLVQSAQVPRADAPR